MIGLDLPGVKPVKDIEWIEYTNEDNLERYLLDINPNYLVHAAFVNRKPANWSDQYYLSDMIESNIRLFGMLSDIDTKVLLLSSSALYEPGNSNEMIDEKYTINPVTIYGVAKVIQERIAQYYSTISGFSLSILRLFNLIGPGQAQGMVIPDWIRSIEAIMKDKEQLLKVRTLSTSRDFVDVRDAARAILMVIDNYQANMTLNVASGKATKLSEIAEILVELCPVPLSIKEANTKISSKNILTQCGSFELIKNKFSWSPRFSIKQSVTDAWNEYNLNDS